MITKERAEILTEVLTSDQERAKKLLGLEPSVALTQINALGYDFALAEIIAYGDAIKAVTVQDGELALDSLDNVAGGIAPLIIALAIAIPSGIAAGGIARTGIW